ncbi:DUF3307 domain-containing protein [Candidatus Parcubacteria bacterium]|jgi:hypothetical protein|nr:DUF3307 domain-containing protein [Candidatus Parcubacteria bacterium]
MEDLFARIVFGHLAGDYLLQTKAMALNKTLPGIRGITWCSWHCLIYTAAMALFLWTLNPLLIGFIFISHWVIDRWSWGQKWLNLIRGRNFIQAHASQEQYREIDIAFSCLVYAVVDNTLHLLIVWLIAKSW